jgi:hypothetical protein
MWRICRIENANYPGYPLDKIAILSFALLILANTKVDLAFNSDITREHTDQH